MTMEQKKVESILKEIEKYKKQIERRTEILNKKIDKCVKLDCNWSREEWFSNRENATEAQADAYFEKYCKEGDLDEAIAHLENAEKRLAKANVAYDLVKADEETAEKAAKIEAHWLTAEERKEKYEAWLAEFKAECLKDGVVIDEAYNNYVTGTTKSGYKFYIDSNNGFTIRSRHCYSLRINGNLVFTSGDFETAYRYLIK